MSRLHYASQSPAAKGFGLGALVVGLVALVVFAVVRETAGPGNRDVANANFAGGLDHEHDVPPLSPEEEAYAAALWPIHSEVKLAAVRMIFAGLAYKTENKDAKLLKTKVQPLTRTFRSAASRAHGLRPPPSLAAAHSSYLEALDLYAGATLEMIKVADDGQDEHLVDAQARSERASTAIIRLSDTLWPGEYKPN